MVGRRTGEKKGEKLESGGKEYEAGRWGAWGGEKLVMGPEKKRENGEGWGAQRRLAACAWV